MDVKIHKQGKRYNTDAERRKGYLDAQLRYEKKNGNVKLVIFLWGKETNGNI